MGKNEGVSKVNQRGLKAQKHIAQGSALGIMENIINNAPCFTLIEQVFFEISYFNLC